MGCAHGEGATARASRCGDERIRGRHLHLGTLLLRPPSSRAMALLTCGRYVTSQLERITLILCCLDLRDNIESSDGRERSTLE